MQIEPEGEGVSARADLLAAIVLVLLGLAVVYLSWTMNRLEARHIHPATIPGLVPLILGAGLTLCGSLLAIRSIRLGQPGAWAGLWQTLISPQAVRASTVLAMALVYTLVLVGRMPFWLASAIFIFAFILVFETVLAETRQPIVRTLFWAAFVAIVGSLFVYVVFQRIFLVRLP
jgi:putative tricarboxylic transport membrane protein